jgi:hypothetical protein
MPALFGYLIALAVILCSGYAGLEWLAAPDDSTTYQRHNEKGSSAIKHSPPNKSPAVADARVKAEGPDPSTTAKVNDTGRDEGKPKGADAGDSLKAQNSAVPTGGCMPIGLTAAGEMVFPLQCRELIEHQRGPVVSSPPATLAPPARDQIDAQNSGKPHETSGNAVVSVSPTQEPLTGDASISEPKLSNPNDETKPTNTEDSGAVNTPIRNGRNEVASDDVSGTGTIKPSVGPSSADETKKVAQQRATPKRSKLVMMTLETIEFADGHREQRLVPFKRFQKPLVQGDWYNALGLR